MAYRIFSPVLLFCKVLFTQALLHSDEIWFEIGFSGSKIGYSVIKFEAHRSRVEEKVYMKLKALGTEREVRTALEWVPGKNWEFETLKFTMESSGTKTDVFAFRKGDKLEVQIRGERQVFRTGSEVFSGSSYIFLLRDAIRSGNVTKDFLLDYFDPSVLRLDKLRIVPVERRGDVLKFRKDFAGIASFLYFDSNGNFIREESDSGMTIWASVREKALETNPGQVDIVISTSIAVEGRKPDSSQRVKMSEARIYIRGDVDIPSFPPIQVASKKDRAILVELKRGYITDNRNLEKFLSSEPLIESDSPEIRKVADKIKSQAKSHNPTAIMKAVSDWLYKSLKKKSVLGMPSALESLRTKEGDCNEHSILAVAILRALGIPSRVVFGLVYDSGYFFFHAWVEAFDGEKWIEFDPTWGLFPADILRIRLGVGNVSEWVKVLEYVGRMKVSFESWK